MENLRKSRKLLGLSQQRLADCMGKSQTQIHCYETGAYEPDICTLIQLADFLGTSVDFLVGRTDADRKSDLVCGCVLSESDTKLIRAINQLTPEQRRLLSIFLNGLGKQI